MSQPPFIYPPPTPYPPPSNRPTPVTVLAIIGIVFGGLGVLCLGLGGLFQLVSTASPQMVRAMPQTTAERAINLVLVLCGFLLSGTLLVASIGCLTLKPAARRVMVNWAVIDIGFDLARLLISIFIFLQRAGDNAAFQQNPNAPQMAAIVRVFGISGMVLMWMISTTYAGFVFGFFRKADIIAAFEGTNQNPNSVIPLPPM